MTCLYEISDLPHGMKMTFDVPLICSAQRMWVSVRAGSWGCSFPSRRGMQGKRPGLFVHKQQLYPETQSLTVAAPGQSTLLPAAGCLMLQRWWNLKGASEQVVIMTDRMTACADMQPRNKTPRLANKSSWKVFHWHCVSCLTPLKLEGGGGIVSLGIQRYNRPAERQGEWLTFVPFAVIISAPVLMLIV